MTSVLALNPGHDGALAFVADGKLVFSLEGEKDSFERNGPVTAALLVDALTEAPEFPDVIALGGWHKLLPGLLHGLAAGYEGLTPGQITSGKVFGRSVDVYSSTHERSHLYGGVALSPFEANSELALLVWEGVIGAFYRWRGPREPIERIDVIDQPGGRYAALFCLANDAFPASGGWPPSAAAGKLMALVGLADDRSPSQDSVHVVESLLTIKSLYPFHKERYRRSDLYNCGVTDAEFCRAARYLSQRLFDTYLEAARAIFEPGLPLVITGGCGLNCDWNSAWRTCDIFSDVFVPPVANDSGSAIGTAVDALVQTDGSCSLDWDVYCGPRFVDDCRPEANGWSTRPADPADVSRVIEDGNVVAWVKDRCEIGPRALGNRSLLASAADPLSHKRLNSIKQRETYRPIAPVCLEEDLHQWFDRDHADPYMLYFRRVCLPEQIPAVTHVDGTARVQSVTQESHNLLHDLLLAHRERTGIGVLCNTSLNFSGKGFINRTSELLHYCDIAGIDHAIINDQLHVRADNSSNRSDLEKGPGR